MSFSEIYKMYFPRMLRFANTYVVDSSEAENIVQNIFVYLWENKKELEAVRSIQGYLFTLVKHRCIEYLRKKVTKLGKENTLDSVSGMECKYKLYSLEAFDETKFSLDELNQMIRTAVDNLPEQCRHIFIASKIHNVKYKELAKEMGLSEQTIKNQMMIAVRKLRHELKNIIPLLIFLIDWE